MNIIYTKMTVYEKSERCEIKYLRHQTELYSRVYRCAEDKGRTEFYVKGSFILTSCFAPTVITTDREVYVSVKPVAYRVCAS